MKNMLAQRLRTVASLLAQELELLAESRSNTADEYTRQNFEIWQNDARNDAEHLRALLIAIEQEIEQERL